MFTPALVVVPARHRRRECRCRRRGPQPPGRPSGMRKVPPPGNRKFPPNGELLVPLVPLLDAVAEEGRGEERSASTTCWPRCEAARDLGPFGADHADADDDGRRSCRRRARSTVCRSTEARDRRGRHRERGLGALGDDRDRPGRAVSELRLGIVEARRRRGSSWWPTMLDVGATEIDVDLAGQAPVRAVGDDRRALTDRDLAHVRDAHRGRDLEAAGALHDDVGGRRRGGHGVAGRHVDGDDGALDRAGDRGLGERLVRGRHARRSRRRPRPGRTRGRRPTAPTKRRTTRSRRCRPEPPSRPSPSRRVPERPVAPEPLLGVVVGVVAGVVARWASRSSSAVDASARWCWAVATSFCAVSTLPSAVWHAVRSASWADAPEPPWTHPRVRSMPARRRSIRPRPRRTPSSRCRARSSPRRARCRRSAARRAPPAGPRRAAGRRAWPR